MRREIPLLLTIVFGCLMVVAFFVPHPAVAALAGELQAWTIPVAAAAVVLGVANVGRLHVRRLSRRERDWFYSLPLLFGIALMAILGMLPAGVWTAMGLGAGGIAPGSPFDYLYMNAYVPMQSTMFSLLAFYIASAAFRAFRIRRVEAALLAVAAVLVMVGRVPVGAATWDGLPVISSWIMDVPNMAAKRAILIGAALGAIATGLKIILGIERNVLGSD